MFKRTLSVVLALLLASLSLSVPSTNSRTLRPDYLPAETHQRDLIVCLKDEITSETQVRYKEFCARYGLELVGGSINYLSPMRAAPGANLFGVRVPNGKDELEVLEALRRDPQVDYAEERIPIPLLPLQFETETRHTDFTTEPDNGATSQKLLGADFRWLQWALPAMHVVDGLVTSVKVGVVDTGCDPSLASHIVWGYDFVNNSSDYSDHWNHGKDMAGFIAGPLGALQDAPLYALKCATPDGNIDLLGFAKAVDYAIAEGIGVLNCSFGATGRNPSETQVRTVERARAAGIIVVAGAGNAGQNIDDVAYSWNVSSANVLRVGATDRDGSVASFSNTGHRWLDVMSPGNGMSPESTESVFIWASGTSVSTAWVSAQAALLAKGMAGWIDVVDRIRRSVDVSDMLIGKVFTGGRVNFERSQREDLNPAKEVLDIIRLKLKKNKKLSLSVEVTQSDNAAVFPAVRVYANDTLLGFAERDEPAVCSFFTKGDFATNTTIRLFSSGGGRAAWMNFQEQSQAARAPLGSAYSQRWTSGTLGMTTASRD